MAQEILTGNLLQDGITYHASDINAAVNNATVQPGIIENRALVAASQQDKIIASRSGSFIGTNILSVMALTRTNMQTAGNCNIHEGVSFSGQITVATTGTLNNWNPTNFSSSTIITTSGTATVTGMLAPAVVGTLKVLSPNSGNLTLKREDVNSSAANRMFWGTATQLVLTGNECAVFLYFNSRWVLIATTDGI